MKYFHYINESKYKSLFKMSLCTFAFPCWLHCSFLKFSHSYQDIIVTRVVRLLYFYLAIMYEIVPKGDDIGLCWLF